MDKTRILFVMLQLDAGGSERVVFDLARSLDPDKFDVYVVAFKGGVLADQLKKICKDVLIISKKPGLDVMAMLKLSNIIKQYRIDVVNAHHYMPCFYSFLGTRILNDKKLVYTEHSVPEVESIADCFHGKIFHWMLYRIAAVIGVSKAITEKFKQKYPRHADKFHEIMNGVDIDKFKSRNTKDEVRSRWGIAKECFVVGTVANFRKVKNHVCLVRAVGRLKEYYPDLRLLFVGTGFQGDIENSENEVRALVAKSGLEDRVVFAGYQENIPEMLSAMDAFCLPSFSEGLPVSLLESMAAGVPVIGSKVSGIMEVVKHGKTGLLFPSDDDGQLAQLLEVLIANPETSIMIANNCNEYILDHSNTAWAVKYENLFLEGKL